VKFVHREGKYKILPFTFTAYNASPEGTQLQFHYSKLPADKPPPDCAQHLSALTVHNYEIQSIHPHAALQPFLGPDLPQKVPPFFFSIPSSSAPTSFSQYL
jgi:hypothetical protein